MGPGTHGPGDPWDHAWSGETRGARSPARSLAFGQPAETVPCPITQGSSQVLHGYLQGPYMIGPFATTLLKAAPPIVCPQHFLRMTTRIVLLHPHGLVII